MLELYKNIKIRRKELRLTQQEVADKLGYKDRGIISKIERGEVDLSISKIHEFAKVLGVSAELLMGNDGLCDNVIDNAILQLKGILSDLNEEAIEKVVEYARLLNQSGEYKKHNSVGMVEEA